LSLCVPVFLLSVSSGFVEADVQRMSVSSSRIPRGGGAWGGHLDPPSSPHMSTAMGRANSTP